MKDYLVKALAYDGQARAYAVRSTDTVGEAQRRHQTLRVASAALGRTLSVGAMMGAMLKDDAKITIKIDGGGPLGPILVDSNTKGEVKGYVTNPRVEVDNISHAKLNVGEAVGRDGTLTIVKDLGMRDFFSGQVPLVSGELGEDFTYYFASSEQVPSAVGVGVLVNPDESILAAGGFIIQLMPDAKEQTIANIEEKISNMPSVSSLIEKGLTPEELLEEILGKGNVKFLETLPVSYSCNCSKEKFATAIIGLGKGEISDMIEEDGQAEVHCHFCNEFYLFTKEDLEALHKEAQ